MYGAGLITLYDDTERERRAIDDPLPGGRGDRRGARRSGRTFPARRRIPQTIARARMRNHGRLRARRDALRRTPKLRTPRAGFAARPGANRPRAQASIVA